MPTPHAVKIMVSVRQKEVLKALAGASKGSYSEVMRAKIILLAGENRKNVEISKELNVLHHIVRKWRQRWYEEELYLKEDNLTDKELKGMIREVLSDKPRPGTPPKFTAEQVAQIIALACENPYDSGYPVTHWNSNLLGIEAVKRGIVEGIAESTIRSFLKGSRTKTPPGKAVA